MGLDHSIARGNFKLTENRTDDALPANAPTPKCCGQTARCWQWHLLDFWHFFELYVYLDRVIVSLFQGQARGYERITLFLPHLFQPFLSYTSLKWWPSKCSTKKGNDWVISSPLACPCSFPRTSFFSYGPLSFALMDPIQSSKKVCNTVLQHRLYQGFLGVL